MKIEDRPKRESSILPSLTDGETAPNKKEGVQDVPAVPVMYPLCSSFDKSSSVFCLVSGISKVEKMPVNMKKANISMMCFTNLFVPPILMSCPNPSWAMTAPSLPDAAEIPCAVER